MPMPSYTPFSHTARVKRVMRELEDIQMMYKEAIDIVRPLQTEGSLGILASTEHHLDHLFGLVQF